MVKATTLSFYSIQWIFIRDTLVKFDNLYLPKSPDIEQNSDRGISNFWISDQSLIKSSCYNSWTSGDVNIKLWVVCNLEMRS